MPKYRVTGANRLNGKDMAIEVSATDPLAAERQANDFGMMVARVEKVVPLASPATPTHPRPQTVTVTTTNTAALALGIIATVVGALALLVGWVPYLGLLAIPFALIGGVLAGVGLFVAMCSGLRGMGMPLLGGCLCVAAVALPMATTGWTRAAWADASERVVTMKEDAQEQRIEAAKQELIAGWPSLWQQHLDSDYGTVEMFDAAGREVIAGMAEDPAMRDDLTALWQELLEHEFARDEIAAEEDVESDEQESRDAEERDYVRTMRLVLYDITADHMDSVFGEQTPGVLFKLRNNGDRSIDLVKVTMYFKDAAGKTIAEEDFYPVDVSNGDKPLKPGYIWQMERDRFYHASSVPTEWHEGSVVAKIAELHFSD